MTKEITKAFILQELQDKFSLREFEPAKFLFDETVIPTYDINPHIVHPVIVFASVEITSAPDAYNFFVVPENERWWLQGYNVVFMATGAYTVTGLFMHHFNDATNMQYLDMTAGQTVSYAKRLPVPVLLQPRTSLEVYVDAYTSTNYLRLYIHYLREEIS